MITDTVLVPLRSGSYHNVVLPNALEFRFPLTKEQCATARLNAQYSPVCHASVIKKVMDFSLEGWTVGQAADDLNSSLFNPVNHSGASKKKKQKHLKKTAAEKESNDGKNNSSKNVDSRKMLEGKQLDMQNENTQKLSKSKKASKKLKKKLEGRVSCPEDSVHKGSDGGKCKREKKESRISSKEGQDRVTQCPQVNGIKRKAQQEENQSPSKKQKHNEQISPVDNPNKSTGRKRKKKKKNSNKRNKYKHLSVKKNETKSSEEEDSGNVSVQVSGGNTGETAKLSSDRPTGEKMKEERPSGVKHSNMSDIVENNKAVLLGSQGKKKKKKDKNTDPSLKKLKQNKCDKIPVNEDLVQPGVKSDRKQEKKGVKEKFQVKVLDKMLSDSHTSVSMFKQPVQAESLESGETTLSLKQRMLDKLKSARFRFLNEQLYKQTGSESYSMFDEDKEAFEVYHQGFQSQVAKWPVNPVNIIIGQLQARPPNLVIADFGCGDAILARTLKNQVHSFDLVAINKHVTACDMAKVPLKSGIVDVAVFCLSLMGKNLPDYLREASRVLKPGGSLKVAEVTSRIRSLPHFKKTMDNFGFRLLNEDTTNKMFCLLDFKKCKVPKNPPAEFCLEPCLYKRR